MTGSKALLVATRPFAHEVRWQSWWHLATTLSLLCASMVFLCSPLPWPVRLPFCFLASLLLIRFFVLYHDHQHGAILRGSKVASLVMTAFGLITLNPPSVWKRSHDHHHLNNSRNFSPNIGSYPLLTVDAYTGASMLQRFLYAGTRHPLIMACAYLTVFLIGMCVRPLLTNPFRHLDAALAIACHGGFLWWLAQGGLDDLWLAGIIPFGVSCALGAYLFFAQHNFPDAKLFPGEQWDYTFAALNSSSYIRMGRLMRWFTANIGYHHVHHLNSKIPFYRLPEAMAAIKDLQSPGTTSLHPKDVAACLRLKLWDCAADRLVPWNQAQIAGRRELRKSA